MSSFHSIESIIEDMRQGRMVIVTDDEDRENEGDLIFPAERVTAEKVNFMMRFGRGLVCVPMAADLIEKLQLEAMNPQAEDPMKTAFTLSVDARDDVSTGISAFDRAKTIKLLAQKNAVRANFVIPGHIFPLKAKQGGVLRRAGHTEAAVDLARLAGLQPAGVICEIINDDGSMARMPDLVKFAEHHQLKIGTIKDLIEYRRQKDTLVRRVSESPWQNPIGDWKLVIYESAVDQSEHVVLICGQITEAPTLVRVCGDCFAGDVVEAFKPTEDSELSVMMKQIQREGSGAILYMNQSGRAVDFAKSIRKEDSIQAGTDSLPPLRKDFRDYGLGAQILKDLGFKKLRLFAHHVKKMAAFEGHGLEITEQIELKAGKVKV